MKNYVGRKIRGFKFKSSKTLSYIPSFMDKHIGEEGIIKSQSGNHVKVRFNSGNWFSYPISMIEANLLPEDFELLKKGDMILVSVDGKSWVERIFIAYIEESISPIVTVIANNENEFKKGGKVPMYFWKYWKPLPEKIKLTKQEIASKLGISIENLEIVQ